MGDAHIAEVPGLVVDAGELRLGLVVADHPAIILAVFVDPGVLPGAVVVAAGAVAVEDGQVHHQGGVVLAAPGLGHILLRVVQAAALRALVKEVLLLLRRAVAGHHIDGLASPLGREVIQQGVERLHGRRGQVQLCGADVVAVALLLIEAHQLLVLREVIVRPVVHQYQLPGVYGLLPQVRQGAGDTGVRGHVLRRGLRLISRPGRLRAAGTAPAVNVLTVRLSGRLLPAQHGTEEKKVPRRQRRNQNNKDQQRRDIGAPPSAAIRSAHRKMPPVLLPG